MPEVSQYKVQQREHIEMLIKHVGVHEGRWMLVVEFGLAAGNFGPDESSLRPGAVVAINSIGIQRAPPDTPSSLCVDAAEVNPPPKGKGTSAAKKA